jgi:hypothetical protein
LAEEAAILLELAFVAHRLRDVAGTEVWQHVSERLSPESRAQVIDTLQDIESVSRAMRESLEDDDQSNYGLQR